MGTLEDVAHPLELILVAARERSNRAATAVALAMGRRIGAVDRAEANWQTWFTEEAVAAGVPQSFLDEFEMATEAEFLAQDACFAMYEAR